MTDREEFEAKFPVPAGVQWDGSKYLVQDGWENSYRCDRFVAQWDAWKSARISRIEMPTPVCTYKASDGVTDWPAYSFEQMQAARATADHRDSVIEECCAAIKAEDDRMADEDYMLDSDDCIRVCRALKSQQDAAIESQRSEK